MDVARNGHYLVDAILLFSYLGIKQLRKALMILILM